MKSPLRALLLVTTAVSVISLVNAQSLTTGGTSVGGDVNQTVVVRNAVNIAAGQNAQAGLSAATVHGGSEIKGSVNQVVVSDNIVNMAVGNRSKSCLQLATVGNNPACK